MDRTNPKAAKAAESLRVAAAFVAETGILPITVHPATKRRDRAQVLVRPQDFLALGVSPAVVRISLENEPRSECLRASMTVAGVDVYAVDFPSEWDRVLGAAKEVA